MDICLDATIAEDFGPNGRDNRRFGGISSAQSVEIIERCVYNRLFDRVKLRGAGWLCIKLVGPHV